MIQYIQFPNSLNLYGKEKNQYIMKITKCTSTDTKLTCRCGFASTLRVGILYGVYSVHTYITIIITPYSAQ